MHSELRCTNVDRLDSCLGGHHWSNGRTAKRVVPHDELLDRHASLGSEHFKHTGADRVSHVPLIRIDLQNDSLLDLGHMLALVLLTVVGVDSVGHIGAQQETPVDSLKVLLLVEGCKGTENALSNLDGHVAVSALG